ncbi:unnamed protein product [Ranitomeya imitator]|uniref:Nurim n=1 Tax=Ranitomeya imitator TaxID=111125 RepID=A0ABN9MD63_9NEOB|nr:unnamed protein product [Ranitomeya imitator]
MSADSQASHPGSPVPSRPTCVALGIASFLCFVAGLWHWGRNISGGLEDERPLLWRDAVGDASFLRSLGLNVALLIIFVVQHSLMAWPAVKEAVVKVFGVLQRSVYILCTAASLQILMRYWQPFPRGPYLWNVTTAPWSAWLPLLCALLHTVSWLLIFSVLLIFDYAELMGVKQVYYHCLGMGDPLSHKSPRAARLYAHLRHPIYLELLVILWAVPSLPPDRLLLSSALTLYLSLVHRLDVQDYSYLRSQLEKKFTLFSRERKRAPSMADCGKKTELGERVYQRAARRRGIRTALLGAKLRPRYLGLMTLSLLSHDNRLDSRSLADPEQKS